MRANKTGSCIVKALVNRESGLGRQGAIVFKQIALELAEYSLLEKLKTDDLWKPLDYLQNETDSVFNIEQSRNGCFAATVQTNRSVNVFEVTSMRKTAEFCTNERSVWTLSFHPASSNIIAFGTLGGKVFVYVDGVEIATLEGQDPVGSLCFHPVEHYLIFPNGNEITFWDWRNNSVRHVAMYNDCRCRFLQITSPSTLITGISQTLLFASAGVGKNLASVEPQYMVVSFLRTVHLMVDALEHGITIGNSFSAELKKQFYFWNHLLKWIVNRSDDMRYYGSIEKDSKCVRSFLNPTFKILNRRIDAIVAFAEQVALNEYSQVREDSDADLMIEKYCSQTMLYFEKIGHNFVEHRYGGFLRYIFDLSLARPVLQKLSKLYIKSGYKLTAGDWQIGEQFLDNHSSRSPQGNQYILQAWHTDSFSRESELPDFKEDWKNVITVCLINNDSNVAVSQCEKFIATVRLKAVKELEVRSLFRENFGDCLFVFKFVANFVSLSFSPSGKFVAIGLRCGKRMKFAYILDKDTRWKIGVDFRTNFSAADNRAPEACSPNERVGLKLCLPNDSHNYKEINCIKWAALPGYGLFLGLKSKFIQVYR